VTDHLVLVHLSVQRFSTDYQKIYKRNNFSTPKNYLDFIQNYIIFLRDKRKGCDNLVKRLAGGLVTLKRAAEDTEELSKTLAIQNVVIDEKAVDVGALIKDIDAKTEVAMVKQKFAAEKKAVLDVSAKEIAEASAHAEKELEAAVPAL